MAKKKSINIFMTVVDKAFLAVMLLVFGWVLLVAVIHAPRAEVGGQRMQATEAAREAVTKAHTADQLTRGPTRTTPEDVDREIKWSPQLPEYFAAVTPVETNALDRMPLFPPSTELVEKPRGPFAVPEILALSDVEIKLTHELAVIPTIEDSSAPIEATQPQQVEWQDADFISVKAVIPFKQIREQFKMAFAGPHVNDPLEYHEPIIGFVDLQRSRLVDGRWSDWESAGRLTADELYERDVPEKVGAKSLKQIEVLMQQDRSYIAQQLIAQPQPYEMQTVWAGFEEEDADGEAAPRTAARTPRRSSRRGRAGQGGGYGMEGGFGMEGGYGMQGGFGMEGGYGMQGGYGMEGGYGYGMEGGYGMQGGYGGVTPTTPPTGTGRRTVTASYGEVDKAKQEDWLSQETIDVWAHDGEVQPGGVYRYRLRVGFYNPIAGHDWFNPDQQHLKDQLLLWSEFIEPDKVVRIPKRTLFFPMPLARTATGSDSSEAQVEVYRWHQNQWYSERFRVTPGARIGAPKEVTLESSPDQKLDVDFTTGVTVVDLVPNTVHWYKSGKSVREITTTDIVYRDENGQINRIGIDKRTWPNELNQQQSDIRRQIREQRVAAL